MFPSIPTVPLHVANANADADVLETSKKKEAPRSQYGVKDNIVKIITWEDQHFISISSGTTVLNQAQKPSTETKHPTLINNNPANWPVNLLIPTNIVDLHVPMCISTVH